MSAEAMAPEAKPAAAVIPLAIPLVPAGNWTRICRLDDIPELGARVVQRIGGDIAVFRNADNEVFALRDQCPHKGGPLSQGIVYGRHVACPLHGWNICLEDGNAVAPDLGCAPSYPVQIKDGEVFLKF